MKIITQNSPLIKKAFTRLDSLEKRFRDLVCDTARKHWLTNEEVLKMLRISRNTLAAYRKQGRIRFSQIGPKIFYSKEDIDQFLSAHLQKPIL